MRLIAPFALVALFGACSSEPPPVRSGLRSPSSVDVNGDFALVSSLDESDVRILQLTVPGSPFARFVRAPNPLQALRIPVVNRPIRIRSATKPFELESNGTSIVDGQLVGAHVAFVLSADGQAMSVIGARLNPEPPQTLLELRRATGFGIAIDLDARALGAPGDDADAGSEVWLLTVDGDSVRAVHCAVPPARTLLEDSASALACREVASFSAAQGGAVAALGPGEAVVALHELGTSRFVKLVSGMGDAARIPLGTVRGEVIRLRPAPALRISQPDGTDGSVGAYRWVYGQMSKSSCLDEEDAALKKQLRCGLVRIDTQVEGVSAVTRAITDIETGKLAENADFVLAPQVSYAKPRADADGVVLEPADPQPIIAVEVLSTAAFALTDGIGMERLNGTAGTLRATSLGYFGPVGAGGVRPQLDLQAGPLVTGDQSTLLAIDPALTVSESIFVDVRPYVPNEGESVLSDLIERGITRTRLAIAGDVVEGPDGAVCGTLSDDGARLRVVPAVPACPLAAVVRLRMGGLKPFLVTGSITGIWGRAGPGETVERQVNLTEAGTLSVTSFGFDVAAPTEVGTRWEFALIRGFAPYTYTVVTQDSSCPASLMTGVGFSPERRDIVAGIASGNSLVRYQLVDMRPGSNQTGLADCYP